MARRIDREIPRKLINTAYEVSVKKNSAGEIITSAKTELEVDGETITINNPACWWTVGFSKIEGDWTWENMDKHIKDNT